MNKYFKEVAFDGVEFSKEVTIGRSRDELRDMDKYIDEVIHSSATRIPGFKYIGYRRLDPFEEFDSMLKTNAGKFKTQDVWFEIRETSIRKILLEFQYEGESIYKHFYILAVKNDGLLNMTGSEYYIMPVITDPVIYPYRNYVFIKLFSTKNAIKDVTYTVYADDELTHENVNYIGKLYNNKNLKNPSFGTPETPLSLYLVARYGLDGFIEKYEPNSEIRIITDKEEYKSFVDDKEYVVYRSSGEKPKGLKFTPIEGFVAVAVNRTASYTVKQVAISIIYAFSILPEEIQNYKDGTNEESILFFKLILSKILFKKMFTQMGALTAITDHLEQVESHIDAINRKEINNLGYKVENFYDVIYEVLNAYTELKSKGLKNEYNIEDRKLEVMYYVTYNIIETFNKMFSDIRKQVKQGSATFQSIHKILTGNKVRHNLVLDIIKSSNKILSALLVNVSSDNRFWKITSQVELQSRGKGVYVGKKNDTTPFPYEVRKLRGGAIFMGNLLHIKANAPSPLTTINPFARFDEVGRIILSDEERSEIRYIDHHISNLAKPDEESINEEIDDGII